MSETNPHIRHRVQMPNGEHVEVVYHDRRDASEVDGQPDRPHTHEPTTQPDGVCAADPAHMAGSAGTAGQAGAATPAEMAAQAGVADLSGVGDLSGVSGVGDPRATGDPPGTREAGCGPRDLHVCFNCAGELVYPLDWSEEGVSQWRIVLRCPECEARREGVFEQAVVERLDDELDRAAGALLSDLKRITHANMSEEIEFFARALQADLIVPSDFHR
jgi:hypothetical protein